MAITETASHTQTPGMAKVLTGAWNRFQMWRTYRQTYKALSALTDRDLADIGLSRSNLRSVSYHAAYSAA